MKKVFTSMILVTLLCSAINATTLLKDSFKINFDGYKTANMVATSGTIKEVKYKFGKDESSIKGLLQGASATFSPKNIDMGVDLITNNIVNVFFQNLNGKKDFVVTITNVLESENKGMLSAKIVINNQNETIPLPYTINDGKFEAVGYLDLSVFKNSIKALQELTNVAPGHEGISWPLVKITILADTK